MTDVRDGLIRFLNQLATFIDDQNVQSEEDLARLVRVRSDAERQMLGSSDALAPPGRNTLLEALGYEHRNVEDHPRRTTLIGTIMYAPDYVLSLGGKTVAVVDLKAPGVQLDNERWSRQVCSYCHEVKAPLGLLFNGRDARVFVGPDVRGRAKYGEVFASRAVALAQGRNPRRLADLLLRLHASALDGAAPKVARELALKRLREEKSAARRRQLLTKIVELLATPPDALVEAMAGMNIEWGNLGEPSAPELLAAWRARPRTPAAHSPGTRRHRSSR